MPAIEAARRELARPSGLMYQARLVRRGLRRLAQMAHYRRLSLHSVPVLFANSFPKSGTHLLTQVLQAFPQVGPAVDSGLPAIVTYRGDTGEERGVEEILRELRRLSWGDIAYGHLHALPDIVAHLRRDGMATYFILRDPRDVAVSHVHYVTEMEPRHIHHRYYTQELHSFEARLSASIVGRQEAEWHFPDIRSRFEPYLGWLELPEVLTLRFEAFLQDQAGTTGLVFDHAVQRGFPSYLQRQAAIRTLLENIRPQRSPTFRSGKAGGWQTQFTPEHKRQFKEVAGDLLIRLGYERDNGW
ncbi:MAG: hypothetical protein PHS96_06520 [Anaerolineales bacterium]|nr:hypothetical protein [Anaerolineales bacterium]